MLGDTDAKRTYRGLMLVLSKTYSNRWQAQVSYVWSRGQGTVDNAARTGLGGFAFENPSQALVNADGFLANDRTHELKALASYQVPRAEVLVSGTLTTLSGATYAPMTVLSGRTLNWTGSLNVRLEPRGSERLPTRNVVNLRVEKVFAVDVHRIGLFVDVANLFNDRTAVAVQTLYPTRAVSYADDSGQVQTVDVPYDAPMALVPARQITIGARWSF